jgi:serine-type D-Ala-D-Ala carboxypeptidase (penicillin-binding protein 5/6)
VHLLTNRQNRWAALIVAAAILVLGSAAPERAASPVVLVAETLQQPVPPPEVTCGACIVVDDKGRELFSRAADDHRSNASTTKMVTALIVENSVALDDTVVVSSNAASIGRGGLDLLPGDSYSVEELLYALLLTSSNDSAVALAEHVSGSEEAFVTRMNRLVGSLGAGDTHFVTAHGLDAFDHYSSAHDLAVIGARLLKEPSLAAIVATPRVTIEGPRGPLDLENRNLLLEAYRGAIGIKTGFTAQAGNVLVAAARRSGRTLVAVAMGSADATADARVLLDYGWARLQRTIVVPKGRPIGALVWVSGGATGVITTEAIRGLVDPTNLEMRFEPTDLSDFVHAGDQVGRLIVTEGSKQIGSVATIAVDTVMIEEPPWPAGIASALLRTAGRLTGKL